MHTCGAQYVLLLLLLLLLLMLLLLLLLFCSLFFVTMFLYVHISHQAYQGRGAQGGHLDFHTAPNLWRSKCLKRRRYILFFSRMYLIVSVLTGLFIAQLF